MSLTIDVKDLGAVGDGEADDSRAFEEAVALLAEHGGGRLVVTAANYSIHPINLTSNMILDIRDGATISGIPDKSVWPLIEPLPSYGQGRDHPGPRYSSLLHGEELDNVTIQGYGYNSVLDGNGEYWWDMHRDKTEVYTRGHLIEFLNSTNLVVDHIRLVNSPFWNNHMFNCDNVTMRRMIVEAPEDSPNTDGWDPDSCRNVTIEDSFYSGGDDCVAVKSGWDCFGIQFATPCEHVRVRNVTCHGKFAGIAIGSELSGGVNDVLVQNVTFLKANKPFNIKTGNTRGGYATNIHYEDIVVDGTVDEAVHVDCFHYNDSPNPSCPANYRSPLLPRVQNLTMKNMDGTRATIQSEETYHFACYENSPIENVVMKDVHFPLPESGKGVAWNCTYVHGSAVDVSPSPPCASMQGESYRQQSYPLFLAALVMAGIVWACTTWKLKKRRQALKYEQMQAIEASLPTLEDHQERSPMNPIS